jgi:hypothetical protein
MGPAVKRPEGTYRINVSHVGIRRPRRVLAAVFLLAGAAVLTGCSSTVDHIPTAMGGLPDSVPARPAASPDYPAVHDMPPERTLSRLTPEERKLLQDELIASRNRATELGTNPAYPPTSTQSAGTAGKP